MNLITKEEKAAAVESGERVLLNHPVRVELDSGAVATLDLTAAVKGVPNPYCLTTIDRELVHIDLARGGIESPSETLHIGGMRVSDRGDGGGGDGGGGSGWGDGDDGLGDGYGDGRRGDGPFWLDERTGG